MWHVQWRMQNTIEGANFFFFPFSLHFSVFHSFFLNVRFSFWSCRYIHIREATLQFCSRSWKKCILEPIDNYLGIELTIHSSRSANKDSGTFSSLKLHDDHNHD
jgi:hypothetical protein